MKIKQINLPLHQGTITQTTKDILYCQAASNYAYIYLANGTRLLISRPLSFIVDQVSPSDFFRAHQSYLINLKEVTAYDKNGGGRLRLSNNQYIPLSRAGKRAFIKLLNLD